MTPKDTQLYLMEYNPKQGCYHYNAIDPATREADKAPFSYGWQPVLIIDDDTACNEDFGKITHAILRAGLDINFVVDVARSAIKSLHLNFYDNALFMGRLFVGAKKIAY